ncbi:MAG: hypothetical protein CMC10_04350 [Flavobacteriaceae bacterium]|nr:hypothetical protein [Flavobacteriaceae bacterium]
MISLNYYSLFLIIIIFGCQSIERKNSVPKARKVVSKTIISNIVSNEVSKLSDYSFFDGKLSDLIPSKNVYLYGLNNSLFSDYSFKKRFIYLPEGKKMTYREKEVLHFDEGSIIIKNFYYPNDFRKPEAGRQIIETRLLIKEKNENWKTLSYVWNKEQTEAHLNIIGGETQVSWKDHEGKNQNLNYIIPNQTQCKSCHLLDKKITPIGPIAGQLNRKNIYNGMVHDQLEYFSQQNILLGLPKKEDRPKFAIWNEKKSGNIEDRAKAYLHINCAHCHNDLGPAKNSGLNLTYYETNDRRRGIYKPPIAAGKGSGNLKFSIVPGSPQESIMIYRYNSIDPGIMMPEIGRRTIHKEGIAILEEYIRSL